MKIMITGASGFIGRNLKEDLGARYEIIAPTSRELDLLDDSAVRSFFSAQYVDAVVHCATWDATWNSKKDSSKIFENNLRMFFNIARETERYGRLICLGSGAEFSRRHWIPLMSEDYFDSHVPTDQYGFSKYVINKFICGMRKSVNLRLFGVFGKYEDWRTRFISNAICRALYDLPIVIYQDVAFDYIYVADLAGIIEIFLKSDAKEKAYNVCSGKSYLLSNLAEIALRKLGKDLPVEVIRPGLGREYSGNNSRLIEEFGDIRFTPIEKAIEELCAWYSERKNSLPFDVIRDNERIEFLKKQAAESGI